MNFYDVLSLDGVLLASYPTRALALQYAAKLRAQGQKCHVEGVEIREDREPVRIVVTKRISDFHACIEGKETLWGCGETYAKAIGDLVMAHEEAFNIRMIRDHSKDVR